MSRQMGKESLEKAKLKNQRSISMALPSLSKSVGIDNLQSSIKTNDYLGENKKFVSPIIQRKQKMLTANMFLSKPKIKNLDTKVKHKLEAEVAHLDREAQWRLKNLDMAPKRGVNKLIQEYDADNLLLKSMVAKCMYNDSNV